MRKSRPLCITPSCAIPRRHLTECDADSCRGCLPRPAGDGSLLCAVCTHRIAENAATAALLYDQLARVLTGSNGAGEKMSGSKNPGLALNDDVVDARREIHNELVSWCQLIMEERKFSAPANRVRALAAFVAVNRVWLAAHEGAAEDVVGALRQLARGPAWSLAFPSGTRRISIGACLLSACPGRIVAIIRPADQLLPSALTCSVDPEHRWPAGNWQAVGRALHPDGLAGRYITAHEIATTWRLAVGTIYKLASVERWRRSADGILPRLYLAADVDTTMVRRTGIEPPTSTVEG